MLSINSRKRWCIKQSVSVLTCAADDDKLPSPRTAPDTLLPPRTPSPFCKCEQERQMSLDYRTVISRVYFRPVVGSNRKNFETIFIFWEARRAPSTEESKYTNGQWVPCHVHQRWHTVECYCIIVCPLWHTVPHCFDKYFSNDGRAHGDDNGKCDGPLSESRTCQPGVFHGTRDFFKVGICLIGEDALLRRRGTAGSSINCRSSVCHWFPLFAFVKKKKEIFASF